MWSPLWHALLEFSEVVTDEKSLPNTTKCVQWRHELAHRSGLRNSSVSSLQGRKEMNEDQAPENNNNNKKITLQTPCSRKIQLKFHLKNNLNYFKHVK